MRTALFFVLCCFMFFPFYLNAQYLNPILPDFQVNDSSGTVGSFQHLVTTTTNRNGKNIIVWIDGRNSSHEIFAQFISDSGTFIGSNFKLTSTPYLYEVNQMSLSMDSSGYFLVAWFGSTYDFEDKIFFRRFSPSGMPIDSIHQINRILNTCFFFDADMDKNGNFVITWDDVDSLGYHNIFVQVFDSTGTPRTGIFTVNTGTTGYFLADPAISYAPDGTFVITWKNTTARSKGVYFQRFQKDGTPISSIIQVNNNFGYGSPIAKSTDICHTKSGNFVIIWRSINYSNNNLYGQRFLSDGTPIGGNFQINKDSINVFNDNHSRVSISADDLGNFVVTWNGIPSGSFNSNIYSQQFSATGVPIGNNIKINTQINYIRAFMPDVILNSSGKYFITWIYQNQWETDAFLQTCEFNGSPIGDNVKINDDLLSYSRQGIPSIAINPSGNFVVTWEDHRFGTPDIFARLFNPDGTPLGENFQVNVDTSEIYFVYPDVAMDSVGNFVVVWMDNPYYIHKDIFFRVFSANGTPMTNIIKLHPDSMNIPFGQDEFSVAMCYTGKFVIAWNEFLNGDQPSIQIQLFDLNGTAVSNVLIIDSCTNSGIVAFPDVAMDAAGNFVVTWHKLCNNAKYILTERFSPNGTSLSSKTIVNNDTTHQNFSPAIGMNSNGDFVITWYQYNDSLSGYMVYAQRFSASGYQIGNNFIVNDEPFLPVNNFRRPAVAMEENENYVIIWDKRENNTRTLLGQRFSNTGTPIGTNFRITQSSKAYYPATALWNNRIYNVWEDKQNPNTYIDIWANILDFNSPVNINTKMTKSITNHFVLYRNYPNPFNSSTVIRYKLPKTMLIEIAVFDLLGRKVIDLFKAKQAAGFYQIRWDGKNENGIFVPSGIYFCRIKTKEFTKTQKMIFMR